MNFVEQNTWNIIRDSIAIADPDCKGWCIDAGVGESDYYFEWFAALGYKTLAIEPLPTDQARAAGDLAGVDIAEIALSDHKGVAALYTVGTIHSLNGSLWGSAEQQHIVNTITLVDLIITNGIDSFTALKLDIEGAEGRVLRSLRKPILPSVLSFEFGGVWQRYTKQGQWSDDHMTELLATLAWLYHLGYKGGTVISSGDSDRIQEVSFNQPSIDDLFTPDCNWGNIVAVLG